MKKCRWYLMTVFMILSANIHACFKWDIIEILDECIAPSLCALRDQSKQNYSTLAFVYCSSLYKLEGLTSILIDLLEQDKRPHIQKNTTELSNHLETVSIIMTSLACDENTINFGPLCIELETIRNKLLDLMGLLNPWG